MINVSLRLFMTSSIRNLNSPSDRSRNTVSIPAIAVQIALLSSVMSSGFFRMNKRLQGPQNKDIKKCEVRGGHSS